MALGTNHIISAEIGNFIPELWSDEVVASYKSNLVMAQLVRKLNHRGKKGDTIRIPTPARGVASDKAAETQVTLQQHGTDAGIVVTIDLHKEYSRLIEDFAEVQSLESLRRFYTDDAGYATAKQVDIDLILKGFGDSSGGNWSSNYTAATGVVADAATWPSTAITGDGSAVSTSTAIGSIAAIADTGIRAANRILDVNDVPMANRYFVVRPETKEDLLGIPRFTEQAFVGETGGSNSIRNGLVGEVYSVPVYVTNQLPLPTSASGSAGDLDANFLFHSDAVVLVDQLGVRSQTQYKLEWLGTLFVTDRVYGVKTLRGSSIVPIITK